MDTTAQTSETSTSTTDRFAPADAALAAVVDGLDTLLDALVAAGASDIQAERYQRSLMGAYNAAERLWHDRKPVPPAPRRAATVREAVFGFNSNA